MNVLSVNLVDVAKDIFCRCDAANLFMRKNNDFSNCHRLFEYITFIETGKPIEASDYVEKSDNIHFVVRNICDGNLLFEDLIFISDEKAEELQNFRIQKNDIILAISANCGATFLYLGEYDNYNITISHYLCRIRVNEECLLPKYLVSYLNSNRMKTYFRGVETGKTQKNLSKVYIKNAPIYVPDIDTQKLLCEKIIDLERKIQDIKQSILSTQSIIDTVFQREFGFDYQKFSEQQKIKNWRCCSIGSANNPDLRFSARFHRPAGGFVMEQLTSLTNKKIKNFLAEPIVLGASIAPEDYDENGEAYYVSMATIKTWQFVADGANFVSNNFFNDNSQKTITKDDIIFARSGEGTIGKVAIVEEETDGIFADFTMRIRLKDYNAKFAYYYFRTSYFQYLVEIYKKGLGNNTNIFPIVLQEFPMLDIPLEEQQRIVDKINVEIGKQNVIKEKIAELRSKIDKIIEDTIRGE